MEKIKTYMNKDWCVEDVGCSIIEALKSSDVATTEAPNKGAALACEDYYKKGSFGDALGEEDWGRVCNHLRRLGDACSIPARTHAMTEKCGAFCGSARSRDDKSRAGHEAVGNGAGSSETAQQQSLASIDCWTCPKLGFICAGRRGGVAAASVARAAVPAPPDGRLGERAAEGGRRAAAAPDIIGRHI